MRGVIEINLKILAENCEAMKRNLPQGVLLAAVVKADAYGHGAGEVVKTLNDKADYFVTATVEEAEEVRELTKKPILCLAKIDEEEVTRCILKRIETSVSSEEDLDLLARSSERLGVCASAHLCFDTGMNRMGIKDEKAAYKLINEVFSCKTVSIKGVYSHFFDCKNRVKTAEQFLLFRSFFDSVPKKTIRHIAATEGAEEKCYALDMVRPGIGLYGYGTRGVKPVMAFKSKVARVAKLKKGETVGYGGSFVANEDCFVATVSAGYADGVPRAFTGGEVLIGGKRRRVVGNVCMDYCFALADKAVKTGDEVVFIGSQVGETLTAEDMAHSSGTISYEILTGVKRLKKIYIR